MVINEHLARAMIDHARAEFPNEACGLVAVQNDQVIEFHATQNAAQSPVFFTIDPKQQLRLTLDIEDRDLTLGIFHSHTRTRAYPSRTDVEFAAGYPDALYIILSLANERSPDIRAFRITEGDIREETVDVIPD